MSSIMKGFGVQFVSLGWEFALSPYCFIISSSNFYWEHVLIKCWGLSFSSPWRILPFLSHLLPCLLFFPSGHNMFAELPCHVLSSGLSLGRLHAVILFALVQRGNSWPSLPRLLASALTASPPWAMVSSLSCGEREAAHCGCYSEG